MLNRILLMLSLAAMACNKHDSNPGLPQAQVLRYGDSVFYLSPLGNETKIAPVTTGSGRYFGFPQGIDIDGNTGVINVSKSETGLRYEVYFVPDGSQDTVSTVITVSGINYLDGFYKLSTGDSILRPLYNGRVGQTIPGVNNGSVFDEGANCNSQGCTVNVANAEINLAQTVRNGVFGTTPANNDRHEFRLDYRINDKSGKASNTLNVKLYFFNSMADVTQEAYDILSSRRGTILDYTGPGLISASPSRITTTAGRSIVTGFNAAAAKPRPPCIFIIAR